jgi:hypothetical protein
VSYKETLPWNPPFKVTDIDGSDMSNGVTVVEATGLPNTTQANSLSIVEKNITGLESVDSQPGFGELDSSAFLSLQRQTRKRRASKATTSPPITPPAIAPAGTLLDFDDVDEFCVAVIVGGHVGVPVFVQLSDNCNKGEVSELHTLSLPY